MEDNVVKSRVDFVADQLIQIIITDELQAGDKLPNEFELAKLLNVGRSTIREAMKKLESQNILVIKQGSGTFISDKRGLVDDPMGLKFFKDKLKLAKDLLDIRMLIEPAIAEMAALNATTEDIEKIRYYSKKVEKDVANKVDHNKNDVLFHTAIANSSNNLVVPNLIPIINKSIKVITDVTYRELAELSVEHHREILEAIANHDPISARDTMVLHIVYNRKHLNKILNDRL